MRVCDWIAEYLYSIGVERVYGLMGGGAAGLNDGFISNGNIQYICFHHEQGAGHAATGESKVTGKLAVVNPTTGCGGTNCITSLLNAWQDSLPVLFISGNVRKDNCTRWLNQQQNLSIRKYGIQEHDIIETVKSLTKYSKFVDNAADVEFEVKHAIYTATTGRPGPVWLDIPSDVQTAAMPTLNSCYVGHSIKPMPDFVAVENILKCLSTAARPVVLAGQGIKQSNTVDQFVNFVEGRQLPCVFTYGGTDILPYNHKLHVGAIGIKGSRVGNFVMQAADVLLILGSSLNSSHIGYDPTSWSPYSKRFMVDIDQNELKKNTVRIDHTLHCDLGDFFQIAERV